MENSQKVSQLLKRYGLRQTPTRSKILNLYLEREYALAHKDIENRLSEEFDRVTIYRTLHTFEEKGLIHKVYDGSTAVKYALCGSECTSESHEHNHIHFTCNKCNKTYCIENVDVPRVELPEQFKTDSAHLFVKGLCNYCNN